MNPVDPPARIPDPPPGLGRLGEALAWLARAQGGWPPRPPQATRQLDLTTGEGFAAGCAEADRLADSGVDLLVLEATGEPAPALAVLCALLDIEPVLAVGTAPGPDWAETVRRVRAGLLDARPLVGEPAQLVADPVLGRATGLLARSAARRTPAVLAGSAVLGAAALVAERLAPGARRWWLAGSQPTGTAVRLAYAELGMTPLLDLGLTVPGGASLAAGLLVQGTSLTADGAP